MSQKKQMLCPRCGTLLEQPFFYEGPEDLCQSCGWGEDRPRKAAPHSSPVQLFLYWIVSLIMVLGPYFWLRKWLSLEAMSSIDQLRFHAYYWGCCGLYVLLASIVEMKTNLDWFNKTGGALLSPSLLFTGIILGLLFPGRIIARTIANTFSLLRSKEE